MKQHRKRLLTIFTALCIMSLGVYLILYNLQDNIVFFYPPSEVDKAKVVEYNKIRIGGLVKAGSVRKLSGSEVHFILTDNKKDITVSYKGVLPALFREGQGIVAEGKFIMQDKMLIANKLLTKHDEKYMPPKIAEFLDPEIDPETSSGSK